MIYLIITIILIAILSVYIAIKINKPKEHDFSIEPDIKTIDLNKEQLTVIDLYYKINIRLPYDILEELTFYNSKDKKEIFQFIELQRNHWKLENSKKMYKNPY